MGVLGAEQGKSGGNTSHLGTRHLIPGASVVLVLLVASVILNFSGRTRRVRFWRDGWWTGWM